MAEMMLATKAVMKMVMKTVKMMNRRRLMKEQAENALACRMNLDRWEIHGRWA